MLDSVQILGIVFGGISLTFFLVSLVFNLVLSYAYARGNIMRMRANEYQRTITAHLAIFSFIASIIHFLIVFNYRNIALFEDRAVLDEINGIKVADLMAVAAGINYIGVINWTLWVMFTNHSTKTVFIPLAIITAVFTYLTYVFPLKLVFFLSWPLMVLVMVMLCAGLYLAGVISDKTRKFIIIPVVLHSTVIAVFQWVGHVSLGDITPFVYYLVNGGAPLVLYTGMVAFTYFILHKVRDQNDKPIFDGKDTDGPGLPIGVVYERTKSHI